MQRILILITNDNFVRNYINTGALNEIEKNFKCFFATNKELKIKLKKKRMFTYSHDNDDKKKYGKICLKQTFLNHNISKSVNFLINKYLQNKIWWTEENFFRKIINIPKRIIVKFYKTFLYLFLSSFIGQLFFKNKKIKLKKNKELEYAIDIANPDLVIIPTQGQDIGDYDMIRICKEKKIKTLSLIDNWDNLSSRVMLKPYADFFGVWGEQSKKHAIKIQKIKKSKVSIIGTPRFNEYKSFQKKSLFNFEYILFFEAFGLTDNLDEILDRLEKILNTRLFKKYKLIYRPHPWRNDNNIINIKKYKNIIIDPQLKKNYLNKKFDSSIQPELSYYPKLISNAKFIISAPTTMVIESLIFKKDTIVLGHKSNTVFDHYNHVVKLDHCDDIEKIDNLQLCWNLDDLYQICKILILKKSKKKNLKNKNSLKLDYFIYQNKSSYGKDLLSLVNKIN